jgi:ferritin
VEDLFAALAEGKSALFDKELWVMCRVIGHEPASRTQANALLKAFDCQSQGMTLNFLESLIADQHHDIKDEFTNGVS